MCHYYSSLHKWAQDARETVARLRAVENFRREHGFADMDPEPEEKEESKMVPRPRVIVIKGHNELLPEQKELIETRFGQWGYPIQFVKVPEHYTLKEIRATVKELTSENSIVIFATGSLVLLSILSKMQAQNFPITVLSLFFDSEDKKWRLF